jgi:hypothetical protein
MNGCVARVRCLLSLPLSSKGGEGNGAVASEHRDACKEQDLSPLSTAVHLSCGIPFDRCFLLSAFSL